MPKFTLIGEHTDLYGNPNGTKVNYEFHCDFLPEVLEHVDMFLKGCGFHPTGTLDYIPDEEYYGAPPEWEPEEDFTELYDEQDIPATKSSHYFDTERNK
jgi:hypothetical protein